MPDLDKRRFVLAATALSVLAGSGGSGLASEGGGGGNGGGEGGGGGNGGGGNGGGEGGGSGNGGGEGGDGGGEGNSGGGEDGSGGGGEGSSGGTGGESFGGSRNSGNHRSHGGMGRGNRDHDSAIRARGRNGLQPLAKVLARAKGRVSGQVISVHLTQQKRGFFYDIKLISKKNRLVTVRVNAVSLRVVSVRGN